MESLGFQHKHIWGMNGLEAGAGNCRGGEQRLGSSSRTGNPGSSLCQGRAGVWKTRGTVWFRNNPRDPLDNWVEQNSWLSFKSYKKPQEKKKPKRCGVRGAPGWAVIPSRLSLLLLPPAFPGMSWSCCTNTIHGSVLTPNPATPAWPSGKWGKLR